MAKYKELYESTKKELDSLKKRMFKQSMTVASIAICASKIDDKQLDNIKRTFYEQMGLTAIRFESISDNSISIMGPCGAIGVADEFFRDMGLEVEYADLIVLRRVSKRLLQTRKATPK